MVFTSSKLEKERKLGVKHPNRGRRDPIRGVIGIVETEIGDRERPFQGNAQDVPNKLDAEIDAAAEVVFGAEDEITCLDSFVICEVFGSGIEDLRIGSREDERVSDVRGNHKHPCDCEVFTDDDIAREVEEVEVARGEEATDVEADSDIGEVEEAFVERPFEGKLAEDVCTVVDKADISFDLKAEGQAFAKTQTRDDEVVIGSFIFDSALPMRGGFGDIRNRHGDADIKARDAKRLCGCKDGRGESKAEFGAKQGKIDLLEGAEAGIIAGVVEVAPTVEEVEMNIIGGGVSLGEKPQAKSNERDNKNREERGVSKWSDCLGFYLHQKPPNDPRSEKIHSFYLSDTTRSWDGADGREAT